MAWSNLKILIIGGGPVGLFAAHALRAVGCDFLLLEQREDIIIDAGACLVLTPATLRVFQQLGLLDRLLAIGYELEKRQTFTLDGHLFDSTLFKCMRKNHGTSLHAFHRAELIKLLYDSLGDDKRKVMTGKKVTDIVTGDDGVTAICDDGSIYQGSIILGADGAHSKTRRLMRELAVKSNPNTDWDLELPYMSTYKCMFFCIPRASAPGLFVDTESKNRSVIYATSKHRAWVFLSEKMQQPTAERANYTAEDADIFARNFGDFPVTESLKIKDVLSQKTSSGMVNLEEGLVKHWSWSRIVLTGDSCHKFTPHAGLGFNNGVQDIVVLLNELRAVSSATGHIPNSADLTTAFQSYQTRRCDPLKADAFVSALITRLQAWDNTIYYLMARYVAPLRLWEYLLWNYVAPRGMKITPVLDDIPAVEPFLGAIEWENKLKPPAAIGRRKS